MKDGKIVLEYYLNGHTATTPWQWASAGKTITSFLVGMAQQENMLRITDTTSDYLGAGWTSATPTQEEKITIWHQLTMTSGLDDGVPDHFCTIDTCLLYLAPAGTRWAYHNGPYTLLDGVIANATGQSLNAYTTQKLKNPTGMTGSFVQVGFNQVYFSTARSMARFGLLILNRGVWNGQAIMTDTAYFNQMVNTSQNLNQSYGYLWWLNGKASHMLPGAQFVFQGSLNPNAPADAIVAMGRDGQFLNVVPSQNLVWIRMGAASSTVAVPYQLNDKIWEYIQDLPCAPAGILPDRSDSNLITVVPNPAGESCKVTSDKPLRSLELLDLRQKTLNRIEHPDIEFTLSLHGLASGMYVLRAGDDKGNIQIFKLIKQ